MQRHALRGGQPQPSFAHRAQHREQPERLPSQADKQGLVFFLERGVEQGRCVFNLAQPALERLRRPEPGAALSDQRTRGALPIRNRARRRRVRPGLGLRVGRAG